MACAKRLVPCGRTARRSPPDARLADGPLVTIASVSYWTDVFTLETWAQAEAQEFRVSGFPPPTTGKGGYSMRMFERVRPGDVLLCYCKTPAQRWVGGLRVTGGVFQSGEPVWGLSETGEPRYPWRFPVEPVVVLEPTRGVPGDQVAEQLQFLSRLKRWGAYLQRSLNRVPDDDGERLLALLQEPREPVPIELPKHRPRQQRHLHRNRDSSRLKRLRLSSQSESSPTRHRRPSHGRTVRFRPNSAT